MKRRLFALATTALLMPLTVSAEDPSPKVGDDAPSFEAKDQDGEAVNSSDLYKAGTTLLFFYPKAGTGG